MIDPAPPPTLSEQGATLARCHLRMMQEILDSSTAAYWDRRAEDFEWARPRAGEHSSASPADRAARDSDLAATAQACRNRAAFIRAYGDQTMAETLADHLRDQLIEAWNGPGIDGQP